MEATIKNIIFQSGTCKFGYGPSNVSLSYIDMENAVTLNTRGRGATTVNVPAGSHGTPTGNIAQLEAELVARWDRENPERIRLSKTAKRRRETLHEFLIEFFENWNQPNGDPAKQTVFVNSNTVQTLNNKRRSLGDLYMICKYYYPTMTLTELLRELYIELPRHFNTGGRRTGFRSSICSQIHKRVWYYAAGSSNEIINSTSNDEYSHQVSWYTENIRQ